MQNSNGYRTNLRQQSVSCNFDLRIRKKPGANAQQQSLGFHRAEQVASEKPVRPSTMIAPIGHGEHEEEPVGLKERIEEQRHKLRDIELEIEEADVPKVPAKVYASSSEENNRPCATHLPLRNWCPICVQAKKRNPTRKCNTSSKTQKHVPVIATDLHMNETTDDTSNPILVTHDSCIEGIWVVFAKNLKNKVANTIRGHGRSKIVIKSDQEPAVRSMARNVVESLFEDDVRELHGCQVMMQPSPVGASAVGGATENAIQRVQAQVRAIRLDVETNIKAKLNPSQTVRG